MITMPCVKPEDLGKFRMINFNKNFHPEFRGFISEYQDGVWISQIESKQIGKGNFSLLIKEFKAKYNWIRIPTPSQMIIKIALHLGFEYRKEYFGEPFNEFGDIMLWEKKHEIK